MTAVEISGRMSTGLRPASVCDVAGENGQEQRERGGADLEVALVARLQPLLRELGEAALGDGEPGAGRGRLEGELDVGLPRVALGGTGDPPAEGEH